MDEKFLSDRDDMNRYHVIRDVIERKLSQAEAGRLLDLSDRQVRRICRRVSQEGPRGIIHRLRGRPSNNQPDGELLERVLSVLHLPEWEGFGPVFARDKLLERFSIQANKETLRLLMIDCGLWQVHRKGRKHRCWRPRFPRLGMLVQLDGSDHDWFEGRGPRCVLLTFIDDATSRILHAQFVDVEDTKTLLRVTGAYLARWGRPGAFYVDKDTIYKANHQATIEEELRDESPLTQFTRAMKQLDVDVITANSPQAKGRVERGFGTHQDRLVKELRLRGIDQQADANRYLEAHYILDHNARCAVEPAQRGDAHRPLTSLHDLDAILALHTPRVVRNDYTIQFRNRAFQIERGQPVRVGPKDAVTVEERLDGSIHLLLRGRYLSFHPIELRLPRPVRVRARDLVARSASRRPLRPRPYQQLSLARVPLCQPASASL